MKNTVPILDTIKKYRWKSLFVQYLVFLLVMFMLPLVIFVFAMRGIETSRINKNIENDAKNTFSIVAVSLENVFSEVNNKYLQVDTNSSVDVFLTIEDFQSYDTIDLSNTINTIMLNSVNNSEYIHSMYIYAKKCGYVLSTQSSAYVDLFYNTEWLERYNENSGRNFAYINTASNDVPYLSFVYEIGKTTGNSEASGIAVINVRKDKLDKLIVGELLKDDSNSYLFDENGNVIYSTSNNGDICCTSDFDCDKFEFENLDNDIYSTRFDNTILCGKKMDNGLRFVSVNSMEIYASDLKTINIFFVLSIAVGAILSILLALFTSAKFYRSIANIVLKIEISADDEKNNINEYEYINDTIMNTLRAKERVEADLVERVGMLKKAQSIALQTQISPHFIFNTLNLISMQTMKFTKGDNDVSDIIRHLSDIIYYTLNTSEYIATFKEEMEYLNKYIEIEQIKSKNAFDVAINIDKGIENVKIIKFIMQPIVENAIEHGLKNLKGRRGLLSICAYIKGSDLVIDVIDDGVGMSKEKLSEIQFKMNSENITETKHIGIANVHHRIKLLYGDEYGINIDANKEYTKVSIALPAET